MSKKMGMHVVISLALVISLAFIVSVAGSKVGAGSTVIAQTEITGDWTASLSNTRGKASGKESDAEKNDDAGKLQLNFERRSERGGRNQMGQSYDFAELQGLSREQVLGGGPVRFSLVREAGRIDCEGSFQNSNGSGTYTFTGNQSFLSAMKSR